MHGVILEKEHNVSVLSHPEIEQHLGSLPDWRFDSHKHALEIGYRFDSFASAISFMMQIAIIADKMNHHPEWSNVYNRVHISLTTHDAGGVSMLDIELAHAMHAAAQTRQAGIL